MRYLVCVEMVVGKYVSYFDYNFLHNISGVQRDALRLVDLVLMVTPESEAKARRPILTLLLRLLTMTGASAPPRAAVLRRLLATCEAVFPVPKTHDAPVKEVCISKFFKRVFNT